MGEEQGRNEIQVGGGYSGVDGAFFNGVYSTRNFLGRGQIVSLALQIGGRSSRYQLSFQEPWFLNRPYLFGFSIFRRDLDYGASLASESTGFGLLLGKRLGRFSNLNLGYNYQERHVETTSSVSQSPTRHDGGTPSTRSRASRRSIDSQTVNNPYRPTRGRSFNASFQIAGGPLGGDTSFFKPIVTFTQYSKAMGKSLIAFHAEGGWCAKWAGRQLISNSNIQGVPRFERFWLGGDTLRAPGLRDAHDHAPALRVLTDDPGTSST